MDQTHCVTRAQRALDQNASQPIYRLYPELIGEIFLLGRPEILPEEARRLPWDNLIRYLVGITSITSYFRRIALDFGELWSVVGFSFGEKDADRCSVVLVMLEAFLERARGCNLHFWMDDSLHLLRPTWFYPRLVTLIKPHAGQVQTFYFLQNGKDHKVWEELCVVVNDAVNLNKLTIQLWSYMTPPFPPLRVTNTLRKLRELRLAGFVYDPSLQETMKQVEILDITHRGGGIIDLHEWLGGSIKLKRLIIPDDEYGTPKSINLKSLPRLEDLTYLCISFQLYQSIMHWISLPNLRHLDIGMWYAAFSDIEPKDHHYPHLRTLRTLRVVLSPSMSDEVALIVMNPQLEYLEIDWGLCGRSISWMLSELSNPRFMVPSGARPTFPGSCLKYIRMIAHGTELAPQSTFLSPILSKDSQLKVDLVYWTMTPVPCEWLKKQFPSQVKCYDTSHDMIPLDELYERAQRE